MEDLIETCRQDDRVYVNIEYGTHVCSMCSYIVWYMYITTIELSRPIQFVFPVPMTTTLAVKGLCIDRKYIVDIIYPIMGTPSDIMLYY